MDLTPLVPLYFIVRGFGEGSGYMYMISLPFGALLLQTYYWIINGKGGPLKTEDLEILDLYSGETVAVVVFAH